MDARIITEEEAIIWCSREEDHFFDRKQTGINGEKLQKLISAFSNSDGGEIVIGISDEKTDKIPLNRWKGMPKIEDFNSYIQVIDKIKQRLDFRLEFLKRDPFNGYVLYIQIEKSTEIIETEKSKVYQRKGAQSLEVKGAFKLQELAYAKGHQSFEDEISQAIDVDDIEGAKELRHFCETNIRAKGIEPLDLLINQHIIDKNWSVKVAAILLFHENPSAVLNKHCGIKVVRYNTPDEDPSRDDLTEDAITLEGPLYKLINESFEKINEFTNKIKTWTYEGYQTPKYPHETVWELLVNAVIHRDYSISDNILVKIFNDRIEIKSPGRLPGIVKLTNILESRHSRNTKLVRMLSYYQNPPNKEMGEGINTAFQKMQDDGKSKPEFSEEENYLVVKIKHSYSGLPEDVVLNFTKKHKEINNIQARNLTGIYDSSAITRIFDKLRRLGHLKHNGLSGTNSAWIEYSISHN